MNACFCRVRFSFFHAEPRDWPGETSLPFCVEWDVEPRLGQSVNRPTDLSDDVQQHEQRRGVVHERVDVESTRVAARVARAPGGTQVRPSVVAVSDATQRERITAAWTAQTSQSYTADSAPTALSSSSSSSSSSS